MPSSVRLGQLSQKTPQRAAPARPCIPCIMPLTVEAQKGCLRLFYFQSTSSPRPLFLINSGNSPSSSEVFSSLLILAATKQHVREKQVACAGTVCSLSLSIRARGQQQITHIRRRVCNILPEIFFCPPVGRRTIGTYGSQVSRISLDYYISI